ncbi:MAG TPA: GMC family oxidoreductase N-terminal domain-containing protein, partial [Gammaproteobacteria bacterium]
MARAVEVVIVGAGAAAGVFAATLAGAGRSVLLLEAGPARTLQQLVSSQLWARRLRWGGAPVFESGAQPIGHAFYAGWGTGGAALHHHGIWPRLHPDDFRLRSRFGRGLDWPFGYDELRPWYDRVQLEVGLAGDAAAEVWRPPAAPYPQPPLPLTAQAELLRSGFARSGLRTAPVPAAVLSQPRGGRAACTQDGWCDAGCPLGALANPLATYLGAALAAGAELRNDTSVIGLGTDLDGRRVTGVQYVGGDGRPRFQEARVVVLAASTVQNSRLLLASASERLPRGLANRSG